jgi:hypothetical protein
MKKFASVLVIAVLITTLSGLVSAQSSGNFTYGTGVGPHRR